MSKRLRALENVAGAELFERSSRGVNVDAGRAFSSTAPPAACCASADSVQALIKTAPSIPVRIASSPTIAELRLRRC